MFDRHISINYCLYLLTVQKDRDTFLSTLLKHMTQKLTGIFYINEIPDFKGVFFSSKFTYKKYSQLKPKPNPFEISFNYCLYFRYEYNPLQI